MVSVCQPIVELNYGIYSNRLTAEDSVLVRLILRSLMSNFSVEQSKLLRRTKPYIFQRNQHITKWLISAPTKTPPFSLYSEYHRDTHPQILLSSWQSHLLYVLSIRLILSDYMSNCPRSYSRPSRTISPIATSMYKQSSHISNILRRYKSGCLRPRYDVHCLEQSSLWLRIYHFYESATYRYVMRLETYDLSNKYPRDAEVRTCESRFASQ